MRLRSGQAINMLGNLFTRFALREPGDVVQMRGGDGVSGLNDEVHWVIGNIVVIGRCFGGWRLSVILREFSRPEKD